MKASSSRPPLSIASGILKLVGLILILSSFLDYAILLLPPSIPSTVPAEQASLTFLQWQQNVTSQLIDRGVIPMVGLAFLFIAFWIDSNTGVPSRKGLQNLLKPGALVLSALLGLAFLLPIPLLNVNSSRLLKAQANQQINQGAEQAETQIKSQSQQLSTLAQNDQLLSQLDQAISTGQIQGAQLNPAQLDQLKERRDLLQKAKQDPKSINQLVEQRQTQIRSQKQQAQKQAQDQFLKSVVRSGLSSLLLAIGYLGIAVLGLASLGGLKAGRR